MRGSAAVPDVSFVVITYNEDANIVNCLSSITSQIGAGSIEVLVVDDGSSDRTADVVAEFAIDRPEIVLLQHPLTEVGGRHGRPESKRRGVNSLRWLMPTSYCRQTGCSAAEPHLWTMSTPLEGSPFRTATSPFSTGDSECTLGPFRRPCR